MKILSNYHKRMLRNGSGTATLFPVRGNGTDVWSFGELKPGVGPI